MPMTYTHADLLIPNGIFFLQLFRLDAKSSRGMIYENEELRIRTININAEVDRGERMKIFRSLRSLSEQTFRSI